MMLSFLQEMNIPHFIVATKADKPNKTDRAKAIEALITSPFAQKAEGIIPFSSLTKEGKDSVLQMILEFLS